MKHSRIDFGELLFHDIAQKKVICCEVELFFLLFGENLININFHEGDLENVNKWFNLACAIIEIG